MHEVLRGQQIDLGDRARAGVEKLLGLLPNAFMDDVEMDTKGKEKEVSVEKILALQAQERKES